MTPTGFEPISSEPESDILSVELRGRYICGAGGIRTLVHTRNRHAFYMLILSLIFVRKPGTSTQFSALAFKFSFHLKGVSETSLKLLAIRKPGRNQAYPPADRLVPAPGAGIKLIYYTSIMLRERNLIRQLLFCDTDLRALSQCSACLHDHSSCCQNQSAP